MSLSPRARQGSRYLIRVFLWYMVMFLGVLPFLILAIFWLKKESARLWNSVDYPQHQDAFDAVNRYGYPYNGQPVDSIFFGNALLAMLIVGLLGWLGYRIVVRRVRPRWHRYMRYWWKSCLLATLLLPAMLILTAIMPRYSFQTSSESYVTLDLIVFMPLAVIYICFAPAFFAVRETRRMGRATWPRCKRCRYTLRGSTGGVCPECGTLIPAATLSRTEGSADAAG